MGKKTFTFLKLKKEKGFTVRKELTEMLMEQKKIKTKILSTLKSGPKTCLLYTSPSPRDRG